ncbi:transglutaminase-like cysteine peptidase [Roseibium sp.]|uniref:transglutaminase-like cysteine peptidase n=1 Tax=Roseibium sp. TaxID=1936156 RepID=UPI003A987B27
MKKSLLVMMAAAFSLGAVYSGSANAFSLGSGTRTLGTSPALKKEHNLRMTQAPFGYQVFCLRNMRECRNSGASSIAYSHNLISKLSRVNARVNRSIRWTRDRRDEWNLASNRGDCEDYALTKRSQLIRMGIPAAALRMAVVRTRKGEPHAVLVVRTSRGDLVLDNKTGSIRPRSKTGYHWVAMASRDPYRWQYL